MKKLGIDKVRITKKDLIELKIDKDELIRRFENTLQGTFNNAKGGEFEAITVSKDNSRGLYIRLHAPWSPNNVNVFWRLAVYSFTVGAKSANFVYEFKTFYRDTMEWYVLSNLAYEFA